MTNHRQAAEDLLKYVAGDEDVWDGYGVAEVATILEPLAHYYLANNPKPTKKPKKPKAKKSKAQEVAEKLSDQFMRNRQFEGQR